MAFEIPIRIYWEDTDAGGIVFYANYLRFFERARTEWLRAALGLGQRELAAKAGGMFVVSEANVKYRSPARLDDELLISAAVQDSAGATVMIEQSARLRAASYARDAWRMSQSHMGRGRLRESISLTYEAKSNGRRRTVKALSEGSQIAYVAQWSFLGYPTLPTFTMYLAVPPSFRRTDSSPDGRLERRFSDTPRTSPVADRLHTAAWWL